MKGNRSKLKNFINKNAHLFWYTPVNLKQEASEELVLEQVLNYSELPTIKEYFKIVGIKRARQLFNNLKGRKKGNIYPEVYKLFSEYFKKRA